MNRPPGPAAGRKRGLGRGLDALLGEERPHPSPADTGPAQIRVDAIRPNPQQPRTLFDPEALAELEQSVRALGVIVPVLVRPIAVPGSAAAYELIAGERRWRAAAAAHLETIPAIIREADDRASLELAVVENLQRRDLDPIEEAMGFAHLVEDYGFTHERLAERVGKSRPSVANALRLLTLSDAIKAKLRGGAISMGHAKALLAVEAAERERVADRILRDGLSVRDVERLAERRKPRAPRTAPPGQRKSADLAAAEDRLRYRLGAPVQLVPLPAGGRIEIRYADEADLARVVDLLLGEDS